MMRHSRLGQLACLLAVALPACNPGIPEGLIDQFRSVAGEYAATAEQRHTITVEGRDGWLFFGPELRHVSVGRFWGDAADAVSRARDTAVADPLPAILDFKRQLDSIGVELLIVPVPPKSIIYPEKVSDAVEIPIPIPRLDTAHQEFYEVLRNAGVDVLDLTERFIDDPRVRFFYDHERVTGESFMKSVPELDENQVLAWDIYMFYDADAEWSEESPPRPDTHMYQLGGDRGTLPRNIRGAELVKTLRSTMAEMAVAD